jgi:hypothetical protein
MATIKELIQEHNELATIVDAQPFKSAPKGGKKGLLIRIAALKREQHSQETGEKLTIRQIAEDALVVVVGKDEHGNELGHPYEDIITIVRGFFPEAETTARSLAWYASKMRCADIHVPYRPRARRS